MFTNIPKNNEWIFFGISTDYENGSIYIYM